MSADLWAACWSVLAWFTVSFLIEGSALDVFVALTCGLGGAVTPSFPLAVPEFWLDTAFLSTSELSAFESLPIGVEAVGAFFISFEEVSFAAAFSLVCSSIGGGVAIGASLELTT